jgi:CSLREA domain-containing protein
MMTTTKNRTTRGKVMALGVLLAALVASLMLTAQPSHASTTFTVDSTADYGDVTRGDGKCDIGTIMLLGERCTLRAAIQEANATSGTDTINFAIPAGQEPVITPATQLPTITGPVTINGYSQPGAQPNTRAVGTDAVLKIVLSGASAPNAEGLVIGASNSTVKGLVINRWFYGIYIDGLNSTGNRIAGNFIGTDPSGTQSAGNYDGVRLRYGSNNTVGGTSAAQRNVISGNLFSGVSLGDGDTTANRVSGNYIGTDASGTKDLGNAHFGVNVDSVSGNTIGGTTAGERNVISANDQEGVTIYARGTRVTGNFIGTDATGTKDLGNSEQGVYVHGRNNVVGGTTAGERNVISANNHEGVLISGSDATGNKVTGNYIGTDASGTNGLGNSTDGVRISAPNNTVGGATAGERNVISANAYQGVRLDGPNATGNKVMGNYIGTDKYGAAALGNSADGVFVIHSPNNAIGGGTAAGRNVIAFNAGSGVSVFGDDATGDRLLQNSIFANGGLGMDLGDDGLTANDPGDADTGPNDLQNKPVINSARTGSLKTTIKGSLNSTPNKTFAVRFFSNPSGTDEGKTFIGQESVTTDGSGNVTFSFVPAQKVGSGRTVTATPPSSRPPGRSSPRRVSAPQDGVSEGIEESRGHQSRSSSLFLVPSQDSRIGQECPNTQGSIVLCHACEGDANRRPAAGGSGCSERRPRAERRRVTNGARTRALRSHNPPKGVAECS